MEVRIRSKFEDVECVIEENAIPVICEDIAATTADTTFVPETRAPKRLLTMSYWPSKGRIKDRIVHWTRPALEDCHPRNIQMGGDSRICRNQHRVGVDAARTISEI